MLLNLVLLVAGFAVLILGANFLVGGASSFARRLRVSELAVGLTIVAFGTSTLFLFTAMFTGERRKLDRWESVLLVLLFIAYMVYIIARN